MWSQVALNGIGTKWKNSRKVEGERGGEGVGGEKVDL